MLACCFLLNLATLEVSTDVKGQLHSQKHSKLIRDLKINEGMVFIQCFLFRCLVFFLKHLWFGVFYLKSCCQDATLR